MSTVANIATVQEAAPIIDRALAILLPRFKVRAADIDAEDRFVAENMAELRQAGLMEIAVPRELGGAGASHGELVDMLRRIARACPSTALAFSMHTHQVAVPAWRWVHQKAPVDGLLRRVVGEHLQLLSSGGSDWLPGSGKAEKVDGGWRVTARKAFASGAPSADLLMTSAIALDAKAGPQVLHFSVPMTATGLRIENTWHTLGMRGTGSHDVVLDGVFVPDAAVALKRNPGVWHPLFHILSMIAFPLVFAVYVGIAEEARDQALRLIGAKARPFATLAVGEMENALLRAQLGLRHMVEAAEGEPGPATTGAVFAGRTLAGGAAIETVEKALEAAGGPGFYRAQGLERLFRDVQGARYHPLTEKAQLDLAGRLALGMPIDA